MEDFKQVLFERLARGGVDSASVKSILKALSKLLTADPNIDSTTANERLRYLGWQDVEVDYHILQLALACFELETPPGAFALGEDDQRRRAMRLREVDTSPVAFSEG
jgi:hypothetical protein